MESVGTPVLWIGFTIFVLGMLALDLGVFHREAHELRVREALGWTGVWISLALLFNLGVYFWFGSELALEFLTGYVIEKSLSVDNIFVFVLIFSSFGVPPKSQHRVLVWGILGALVMRGIMIWLGVTLVSRFHWVLYIFGVFLLVTAVRMFFVKDKEVDYSNTWLMRLSRRSVHVTNGFRNEHFTARENGRFMITPLALVLIMIDVMDLVFAVDSIPAVFAITTDTFIVYTSNICAILGLRSLYFLVAKLMDRFLYLKTGLAIILGFVGLKMLLSERFPIPNYISLLVIVAVLFITITVSIILTRNRSAVAARK